MSKYLISLKPLTPYFFGGENTFGENNINYFAHSNYLPQQTTLLGFLRYELLAQNNLLGSDPIKNDFASLIGKDSFKKINGIFTNSFGSIKNISPVFLSNGSEHFISQAMDWAMCEDEIIGLNDFEIGAQIVKPLHISFENGRGLIITDHSRTEIPIIKAGTKAYNPKYDLKSLLISSDGAKNIQWDYEKVFETGKGFDNGIFIEHEQIGINRKTEKKRDETGDFYKQVFYKLFENFSFSFYADIELPEGKSFESRIVTMGGERSVFQMIVEIAKDTFETKFTSQTFSKQIRRNYPAIILTSDAYVDSGILDKCHFTINETISFRNIITDQTMNADYARLGAGLNKSSELINLVKRGSIFYCDESDELKKLLRNSSFEAIGYNRYIELPSQINQ